MVEAGAHQVPEETMLEAIMFGHDEIKRLIAFQEEIVQAVGKEKSEVKLYEVDADLNKLYVKWLKKICIQQFKYMRNMHVKMQLTK